MSSVIGWLNSSASDAWRASLFVPVTQLVTIKDDERPQSVLFDKVAEILWAA